MTMTTMAMAVGKSPEIRQTGASIYGQEHMTAYVLS
jgi:hypothetical protein